MIRLYMDVHVPSAITDGLRLRSVDVLTAQEDGTAELDDGPLLDHSTTIGRVLFTQDTDFLREGAERQRQSIPFAGIIFAAQSTAAIGAYIRDLELIALAGEPEDCANHILHLPL